MKKNIFMTYENRSNGEWEKELAVAVILQAIRDIRAERGDKWKTLKEYMLINKKEALEFIYSDDAFFWVRVAAVDDEIIYKIRKLIETGEIHSEPRPPRKRKTEVNIESVSGEQGARVGEPRF